MLRHGSAPVYETAEEDPERKKRAALARPLGARPRFAVRACFDVHEEHLGLELEWKSGRNATVKKVLPGGAAAARGVAVGDRLTSVNGRVAKDSESRSYILPKLRERPVALILERRPAATSYFARAPPAWLDLELHVSRDEDQPEQAPGFQLEPEPGRVLVASVAQHSSAWFAGLMPDDEVRTIAGRCAGDFSEAELAVAFQESCVCVAVRRLPEQRGRFGARAFGVVSHGGSGPREIDGARRFKWETPRDPWRLLATVLVSAFKHVATLFLIFYQSTMQQNFLMICNSTQSGLTRAMLCEYTKGFLRAMPLAAVNITLLIGFRTFLQISLYYGLLKRGGLMDFRNASGARDPLFIVLGFSFVHCTAHFVIKAEAAHGLRAMAVGLDGTHIEEYQHALNSFILPFVLFLIFVIQAVDVEQYLVPLNKFFEEDYLYAQSMIANIILMEEHVVCHQCMQSDVVGVTSANDVVALHSLLIGSYPESMHAVPEGIEELWQGSHWRLSRSPLVRALWPASVLLDARWTDDYSKNFRRAFYVYASACMIVSTASILGFVFQLQKDLQDIWGGSYEDILSASVLGVHLVFVGWLLLVVFATARGPQRREQAR